MITIKNAEPFGIADRSNVISDISLINESLCKIESFAHSLDPNPFYWDFFNHARRDEDRDGYIYEFGGYCGTLKYRVTWDDVLEWALNNLEIGCAVPETLNECLNKQRPGWFIVDYAAHIAELCWCDLARWVGMKHISDFVAYYIYCVAAAAGDMSYRVKNGSKLSELWHKMRDMSNAVTDSYSMEELQEVAKASVSVFNEVF